MVEFTVDLGELSALTVLWFGLFGCAFLHIGGGATPDNCEMQGIQEHLFISTVKKDIGSKKDI